VVVEADNVGAEKEHEQEEEEQEFATAKQGHVMMIQKNK
jgi:hypothetical protein